MNHGSLFSGIGGFDLAAEWMGWNNIFNCENNTFCQRILKHHFPNSIQHGDIKTTDFTNYRGRVNIVSGGFPCQPYSTAGKRKGKADDRHLWPEMLRAIREIQPRWVVGENVPGLLNWEGGVVLDEIKADLETAGFEVFPSLVLPACGKNAPHRRDRLWVVANCRSIQRAGEWQKGQQLTFGREALHVLDGVGTQKPFANTESNRINREEKLENDKGQSGEWRGCDINDSVSLSNQNWDTNATNSECGRRPESGRESISKISYNDFQKRWPQVEPLLPRGDDGLSDWVERVKALGNAIVPQIAYEIFKAIQETDNTITNLITPQQSNQKC